MTLSNEDLKYYLETIPSVADAAHLRETVWLNEAMPAYDTLVSEVSDEQIADAEARLARFAPYLATVFPDTVDGVIESPLRYIGAMQHWLNENYGLNIPGELWMKMDSHLPVTGSVKARGGFYEVLKHAEELAIAEGLLQTTDDYTALTQPRFTDFFSRYTVQVGSTGNLGLSIGIMSARIGFHVIVHMSAEAKQWKKDLLREKGVQVIEYDTDYCEAVARGRENSRHNPLSYFIDDEKSIDLFLGYAVAGHRLQKQLVENRIAVDAEHPLLVYIPCGIGGAPGGITYGLKRIFGDNVHCFFTEPMQACCMLLGVATGLHDKVCVQDFGINGKTEADGLAVTRPSELVGRIVAPMLSGVATIEDARLNELMCGLYQTENIFIEPSACACFAGLLRQEGLQRYYTLKNLTDTMQNATQLVWSTGGNLVPTDVRNAYLASCATRR